MRICLVKLALLWMKSSQSTISTALLFYSSEQ